MGQQNRKTLKDKFIEGRMPDAAGFADLIDSTLNMLDDGFEKTRADGFKVTQLGGGRLLSFYHDIDVQSPLWSIQLDLSAERNLLITDKQGTPAFALRRMPDEDGAPADRPSRFGLGLNKEKPEHALDVAGTVASWSRIGRKGELPAPADSEWHDITGTLEGCQAFEIMAGVGKRGSGRYALMHAFAVNTFNGKSHITYHQAHFSSRCCRIELRWHEAGPNNEYKLQMRVGCSYGDGVWIQYYLTGLWPDPFMNDCVVKPGQKGSR